MRHKTFQLLSISFLFILILAGYSSVSFVSADPLLQGTPRLDGFKIYFTEANGEASRFDRSEAGLSRFAGLLRELGAELATVEWRSNFPTDADLVIVAGPVDDYNASQTARLWTYLNNGGKMLLMVDPLAWERGRARGVALESGLFQLLWSDLGVRARNDLVLTEGIVPKIEPLAAAAVSAEATAEATAEPETALPTATPVQMPAPRYQFTTGEKSSDSPIVSDISEPLAFFGARSIEIDLSTREFPVEPLVFSESEFYGENNFPQYYDNGVALYNIGQDVPSGFLPLAVAFENPESQMRLIVIGDRDIATNGRGFQSSPPNTLSFLYRGNIQFMLNSVAWLLGAEPVEVSFPTPGPTATPTLVPTPVIEEGPTVRADLGVNIAVSNMRPGEGEVIIYDLNLINNGPDPVENVIVKYELPAGLEYILADGGTFNSETGEWLVLELAPNEGANLKIVVRVLNGTVRTTITSTAEIMDSNANDVNEANNMDSADITIAAVIREEG
ncbi:MAG: Gldg family protein [Chloroflexi bacterium]|nr:Gldg family protein [Chloroflexota bacterium]